MPPNCLEQHQEHTYMAKKLFGIHHIRRGASEHIKNKSCCKWSETSKILSLSEINFFGVVGDVSGHFWCFVLVVGSISFNF